MEKKEFKKLIYNSDGLVPGLTLCGIVLVLVFGMSAVFSSNPSDKLVGLIALVGSGWIYAKWIEGRKHQKSYKITIQAPEEYEETMTYENTLAFAYQIIKYLNKGEAPEITLKIRELTPEEKQELEEDD